MIDAQTQSIPACPVRPSYPCAGLFRQAFMLSRRMLVIEISFPECRVTHISNGFIDFLQDRYSE